MNTLSVTGIQFGFNLVWLDPKSVVYGWPSYRTASLLMHTWGRVVVVCECFVGLGTFVSTTGVTGTQFGFGLVWLDPTFVVYEWLSCRAVNFPCRTWGRVVVVYECFVGLRI